MVVFVAFLQTTKYRYSRQLVWLVYHHGLESTLKCLVLLEVLLILVEGCSTDASQFATGKCWLQDVGCIHSTLAATGTYKGMNLVDEEDDAAVAVGYFLDNALKTLLKLAFVLGSGNKRTHIQRIELLVLKILWHVASYDTFCQALYYSGLTSTRLTYQYRVVLGTARQYLKHSANLLVTANNRIELALTGFLNKVLGILGKTLIVLIARLRLHLLSLAQLVDSLNGLCLCHAGILKDSACGRVDLQQCQQYRLNACKLVAVLGGKVLCSLQHRIGIVREIRLSALDTRQALYLGIHHSIYLTGIDT